MISGTYQSPYNIVFEAVVYLCELRRAFLIAAAATRHSFAGSRNSCQTLRGTYPETATWFMRYRQCRGRGVRISLSQQRTFLVCNLVSDVVGCLLC